MNKKQAKRRRDIKTKLMAAICMLLVSSIMMVSTTYAWFTLSTAPEVTGINTAVGANGNLEMALQPLGGVDAIAESAVGDSMDELDVRNTTWGNLVDLSYAVGTENFYGLDKITLNPSKLNTISTDKLDVAGALLETPAYGADGRVSELLKNTVTSIYNRGFNQDTGYGVRAVGTASGMTDRQLDYRNYTGEANSAISQATNLSKNSLNENGASLANIAITHFVSKSETHPVADVQALLKIVDDLLGADGKTGVLQHIENAYRALVVAYGASQKSVAAMDDTQFAAFKAAVVGAADLEAAVNQLTAYNVTLPDGIATPVADLLDTIDTVETAQTELTALLSDDSITWEELMVPMGKLVNVDALTMVCGSNSFPVKEAKDRIADIAASINNLVLMMPTGGGVYADVADHCGNYDAKVKLALDVGAIMGGSSSGAAEIEATMRAQSNVHPGYLSVLSNEVAKAGSPAGTTGQVMPISDFYGYVIDLAFRTNAASSNLLLQTEAAGRIYSNENSTEETMGHGASMTFTTAATGFTLEKMQNLMGAIRLVFFDTTSGEIYGYAKLDMGKTGEQNNFTVTGGNTITAKLYLYEKTEAGVTYVEATAEQITAAKTSAEGAVKMYTETTDADGGKSYDEVTDVSTLVEDGSVKYYVLKVTAAGETLITTQEDAVIMALTQNTAQALSVLVYLDGENVTNADVAIDAQSMTGTLNLQFSSSANLVPMNYTPLMNQGGTDETTTPATTEGGN